MYPHFQQEKILDLSEGNIERKYAKGFVFTRLGWGVMQQINSLRVNLTAFKLTSENRRILRKSRGLELSFKTLPLRSYHWQIAKLAKDFYETKFGPGVFSANKMRQLLTSGNSNFKGFFVYSLDKEPLPVGYCVGLMTLKIVHYAYPFYDLKVVSYLPSVGMAMMLKAILWAKEQGRQYIYLGSDQKYKRQFKGLEVFNGKSWQGLVI